MKTKQFKLKSKGLLIILKNKEANNIRLLACEEPFENERVTAEIYIDFDEIKEIIDYLTEQEK